jgi:hypothetical protein
MASLAGRRLGLSGRGYALSVLRRVEAGDPVVALVERGVAEL